MILQINNFFYIILILYYHYIFIITTKQILYYYFFRYHDKRVDHLHEEAKRSYCQKRGMIYVPTNKKGNKLKDSIKYLEVKS